MSASSTAATHVPPLFIIVVLINILITAATIYLFILLVKALRKYLSERHTNQVTVAVRKSLGETIKEYRTQKQITQEFVAEQLGVSRQAVSKWENGTSDPSTSNLLALAKLFGVNASELLKNITE